MTAPSPAFASFASLIQSGRRRMRRAWILRTAEETWPIALAAAAVIAAVGWVRPWTWPEPVAIGLVVAAVSVVFVVGLVVRIEDLEVARAIDNGGIRL